MAKPHIEQLKQVLDQLSSDPDNEAFRTELRHALVVSAESDGAIAIGGDANHCTISTVNIQLTFDTGNAETIRRIFREETKRIGADVSLSSLQDYLCALRLLCNQPSYLTLGIQGQDTRKTQDQLYVPLRARLSNDVTEVMLEEVLLPKGTLSSVKDSAPRIGGDAYSDHSKSLQHILLMCRSGAGKSTALLRFAAAAWDDWSTIGLNQPHIPMVVRLRTLATAEGVTISERLLTALRKAGELSLTKEPPADFFEQWSRLLNAPWLLLFDGLDEVPMEEREKLFRWVNGLVKRFAGQSHRIILTSRPFEDPQFALGETFAVYELQPFSPHQKQDFARRYLGDRADTFLAELEAKGLDESSSTPLLLTIAASIFVKDGSLPGQRATLFQRSIEIWLAEARARGLRQELDDLLFDIAHRGLEQLALAAVEQPERTNQANLAQALSDYLQAELRVPEPQAATQGKRFVEVMGRRSGVFIQRGEICEWAHPAFRDFLAASGLEQQLKKTNYDYELVIGERILAEHWVEPFLILAQITARKPNLVNWAAENVQFIGLLGRVGGKHAIEQLIVLLGVEEPPVSGAAYTALRRIGQPAIAPLLSGVRNTHLTAKERSHSLYALAEVGVRNDEITQAIADCFAQGLVGEATLLRAAIIVARRLRDIKHQSSVLRALASDDEMIAFSAASYLYELPSDTAFPDLLQTFQRWSSPDQQRNFLLRHLLYAMGKTEPPEAIAGILQILRDSLNSKTGLSPLWAAWTADELELPATRALLLEELARLLSEQPTNHLIWQILRRLEEYWQPKDLAALCGASDRLTGSGINVAQLLVDGIIAGTQADAEHPLRDHSGQRAGVTLLAKIQSSDFVQETSRLLAHADWSVENQLLEYLWVAADPTAEAILLQKLSQLQRSPNPDWTYRNDIIRALGTCSTEQAVPAITNYLHTEQNIGLYTAQEALCPLLRRGVLSAASVVEIALNSSASVAGRGVSIEALGRVCPTEMRDVFQRLLGQTKDELILSYTAHVLAETGDTAVIADLESLLATTDSARVAIEAANSLVRLDAQQSTSVIHRAMNRLGVASRSYGLLVALGWFRDETAIPHLKAALNEVRRAVGSHQVIAAMGRFLPAHWARECLLNALESWQGAGIDDGLQEATVETLAQNAPELLIERVIQLYDAGHLYRSACETLTFWIPQLSRKADIDLSSLLEVVKRLLCDHEISVREKMGLQLPRLDAECRQQIYKELRSSPDEWRQACAISLLGYYQIDDAELHSARFAATTRLRYAADLAIKQRQRMDALKDITEQYSSSDGMARLAAYLVIKEQGDERIMDDLYDSLSEKDTAYTYLRQLDHDVRERLKKDRQKLEQEEQKRFD